MNEKKLIQSNIEKSDEHANQTGFIKNHIIVRKHLYN